MYIVQIIDVLSVGGAQQVAFTLGKEALKCGHKVAVLCLSTSAEAVYLQPFRALGIEVWFFPTNRVFDFNNLHRIWNWFRAERPNLIHAHLTYANIIGSFMSIATMTPIVATLHSTGNKENTTISRTEKLELFFLRHVISRIIACGPAVAESIKSKIGERAIQVIPNAVDFPAQEKTTQQERDRLRQEIAGDPRRFIIIAVGRLSAPKGYDTLLEAFALLSQPHPEAFLAIAGGGELYDALSSKIGLLNLAARVKLLGSRQDIPNLLAASDMFVLSSHWEGLPIAILEAMASGLTVVATDVGDVAWAVGTAGVIVPPRQPEALAGALSALLNDEERRAVLGRAALARIQECFDPGHWFAEIETVYQQIMK